MLVLGKNAEKSARFWLEYAALEVESGCSCRTNMGGGGAAAGLGLWLEFQAWVDLPEFMVAAENAGSLDSLWVRLRS